MTKKQRKNDRTAELPFVANTPGLPQGVYKLLPVDQLRIDHANYQRSNIGSSEIEKIAKNFDWPSFGVLSVLERSNGHLYVVDGQRRRLAADLRGITHVPCMVYKSDGPVYEARVFLRMNVQRKTVSAVDKYHAAVKAGNPACRECDAYLKSIGYRVSSSGASKGVIDYASMLVNLWKINSAACRTALEADIAIDSDEPMSGLTFKGLWWLAHNGVDLQKYVLVLKKAGGRITMMSSISAAMVEMGNHSHSTKTCGIGIRNLINKRVRRDKIVIAE